MGQGCHEPRFVQEYDQWVFLRRRKRQRRTWPQRLLIMFNSLLAVACLAGAYGVGYIRDKADELPVTAVPSTRKSIGSGQAINILLVGTDSTEGFNNNEQITEGRENHGELADVVMILRLDPESQRASMISIPRDSYMPVAPRYSKSRINSAFNGPGGADDLIATIRHNFAIAIDHYVKVNFLAFQEVMEVLGGIPVYLDTPVKDSKTGLFLVETGCILIEPVQALAYARSRNMSYQDENGDWVLDRTVDFGRIARQQDFLQAVADRAIDKGIRNPSTALGLLNAGLKVVDVDTELKARDLTELGKSFSSFNVDSLERYQVPTEYAPRYGADYEDVLWDEIDPTLDIFRGYEEGSTPSNRDVLVDIVHSDSDSADLFAALLDQEGFDADVSTESSRSSYSDASTILYGPKGVDAARLLAANLDGPIEFEFSSELRGMRVELVVGESQPSIRSTALSLESIAPPTVPEEYLPTTTTTSTTIPDELDPSASVTSTVDSPLTSTVAETGPETSTLDAETTTTAANGFIPLDADAAERCG